MKQTAVTSLPSSVAVVGQQAAAHVVAEEVAEQAAEVVVARVGEEAARVGDHADEARERPMFESAWIWRLMPSF